MKLTRWMQVVWIGLSVVMLAACTSAHKNRYLQGNQYAVDEANDAYRSHISMRDEAETSGIGESSRFGDGRSRQGALSRDQLLSKHTYYFDFDSNVVHPEDKPAIIANADYLLAHPKAKVMLEGHTDPRGSREYNIALGERRAKAVADIMMAKGVNRAQIRIVSYGAQKLAASGHTEADYQLDRRVALVYLQR